MSDTVIAGNQYLADYAQPHTDNVIIIPTTIDTDEYINSNRSVSDKVTIGWSGSITTIKHFEYALNFLRKLKNKYGEKISIKVIGDESYNNPELGIRGSAWNKENELKDLSSFDIGIMPLPDDEWAKGKCGLSAQSRPAARSLRAHSRAASVTFLCRARFSYSSCTHSSSSGHS